MTKVCYKYPSTGQFRNAIRWLQHNTSGLVELHGTIKLHGTNASIVMDERQEVYFQSKTRVLEEGQDNAGFLAYMSQVNLTPLFARIKEAYFLIYGEYPAYPIEIAGEWAGKGVQKGVGISELDKFFAIFGVRVGNEYDSGGRAIGWLPNDEIYQLRQEEDRIYNASDFGVFSVTVDLNMPQAFSNTLQEITERVEAECPAAKYFGIEKGVGEGVVWRPAKEELASNPQSWFKVKGQKHSVSKVKTLAPVDVEKLEKVHEFVEYACTENRLEQAVQEVGLDQKKVGQFIGWVSRDINKEEADTLEANGFTMKDVGKAIGNKASAFYLEKLNSF